ncbi:MAG: LysR family transcriptional regulator [Chthoniobacteraceae bacterium]|nr:LysR family transcriptional regulator [Chthoniobacteraceae bacterium]
MKYARLFSQNGLSLDRLRTLAEVDEAGNIVSAAPDDESRQSQISRQLAELERFFHIEFKQKSGKSIRLTPAGRQLAKIARQFLGSLEQFQDSCHSHPTEVTIGAGDSLLQWLLLPRMCKVRDAVGPSLIQLQDLQNASICQRLQDHALDFGLLRSDLVTRGSLTGRPLGKFGYSLFIPKSLCPCDAKMTEARLLQELPIATQGENTLFQQRLEEVALSHRWNLNILLLCESFPQAAQILAQGEMAAILPDLARLTLDIDSVWAFPLKSLREMHREIYLAWQPHHLETRPHLECAVERLAAALSFDLQKR